jgi:hypothetical protein
MFWKSVQSWPSFETMVLFTFLTIVPNESWLPQIISYYWEFLSCCTAHTISEMVQAVTHLLLHLEYHVQFLVTLSQVHGGQCDTGQGSTPSFFGFPQKCAVPQNSFIITSWGMKCLWHNHTLSHPCSSSYHEPCIWFVTEYRHKFMLQICNSCRGSSYQILLGANRIDTPETGSAIATSGTSIVHPQYDESTINNDIALIQLPSEISFTSEYFNIVINTK